MLLEFDADQKLWQDTVRDAVAKQCPPALVRSVAEEGVDPTPLWKAYVDAGWTEMNDPGERRRARHRGGRAWPCDGSDAVLGDDDAVRPARRGPFRPARVGDGGVRRGDRAPRHRRVGTRRHRTPCPRRRPGRPVGRRDGGRRVRRRRRRRECASHRGLRSGAAHCRRVVCRAAGARERAGCKTRIPSGRGTSR